jgi:ribosome maturation factor RimP
VHQDGGVTLDTCEAISREVADLLDVEDPFPGRYRLEVTSPGLDRPLRTDQDFARAAGRRLKVILVTGRTLRGRLIDWQSDRVTLEMEHGLERVERPQIAKATIEAEW